MEPDLQGEASTRLPALASDLVHDIDTSLALYISPGAHLHIIYLLPALLVKQGLTFFWISWREHLTLCTIVWMGHILFIHSLMDIWVVSTLCVFVWLL